jgi:hypothetical protein
MVYTKDSYWFAGGYLMDVIYIRINPKEKRLLEQEASKLGMGVTVYCRMILLQSLNKKGVVDAPQRPNSRP